MKGKWALTAIAITLGACANLQAQEEGVKPSASQEPTELPPGVELRKLDAEMWAKLGLDPQDALIALTGTPIDRSEDKTVIFVSDKYTVAPGEFKPGYKLDQYVQIFGLRNSPKCFFIQSGGGFGLYLPRPDCPH